MSVREMYEKLKANVIECVVWAERELSGKSGEEKKAAVKKRLDEMIPLPFYLEWADDLLIDYLIEVVCSQMNAITSRRNSKVLIRSRRPSSASGSGASSRSPDTSSTPAGRSVSSAVTERTSRWQPKAP